MTEYDIRWFEPGDERGILALRNAVWEGTASEAWFAWKYLDVSVLDYVPVVVAEADGEIVGMRPFVQYRMRRGDDRLLGLYSTDTTVHADHRRRGLFTRMTELALERYLDGEPALTFGFANENSRRGYRKFDWTDLGPQRYYYRVQDPSACVAGRGAGDLARLAGRVATPVARSYLRAREALVGRDDADVVRHEGLATDVLASLYRERRPDAVHPVRDEAYYEWRDRNPDGDVHATYVAERDGDPVAAVTTYSNDATEPSTLTLVDAEPMEARDQWFVSLLGRVLDDHADAGYVRAWDPVFRPSVLRRFGFHRSERPPMSWVTTPAPYHLVVRSLSEAGERPVSEGQVENCSPYLWSLKSG